MHINHHQPAHASIYPIYFRPLTHHMEPQCWVNGLFHNQNILFCNQNVLFLNQGLFHNQNVLFFNHEVFADLQYQVWTPIRLWWGKHAPTWKSRATPMVWSHMTWSQAASVSEFRRWWQATADLVQGASRLLESWARAAKWLLVWLKTQSLWTQNS